MLIKSLLLVNIRMASSTSIKAVKILGEANYSNQLADLKEAGWTVDTEKDKLSKSYKFNDFNEVSILEFSNAFG